MTDTARNELAHKLGGTFGATTLPALDIPKNVPLNVPMSAPLGTATSAADGTFEPRHAVTSERVTS